jgi:hypothetical protein
MGKSSLSLTTDKIHAEYLNGLLVRKYRSKAKETKIKKNNENHYYS